MTVLYCGVMTLLKWFWIRMSTQKILNHFLSEYWRESMVIFGCLNRRAFILGEVCTQWNLTHCDVMNLLKWFWIRMSTQKIFNHIMSEYWWQIMVIYFWWSNWREGGHSWVGMHPVKFDIFWGHDSAQVILNENVNSKILNHFLSEYWRENMVIFGCSNWRAFILG